MRSVVVRIADTGVVECDFNEGHISKRDLLRIIRTIKHQYKHSVREFRRSRNVEFAKLKELNNGRAEQESEVGIGVGAEIRSEPASTIVVEPDAGEVNTTGGEVKPASDRIAELQAIAARGRTERETATATKA